MPGPPEAPFRAALLAPTWLGDSVMSTALLPDLAALSGGPVEVWARPVFASVFAGRDDVAAVLPFDPKGAHRGPVGLLRWRRLARARGGPPRAVWIVPDSLSAALAAWATGAPTRIGRAGDGRSPLLTEARSRAGARDEHWIDQQRRLVQPAATGPAAVPGVVVPAAARERLRALLGEAGLGAGDCCVFVAGASYGPAKRWPHFAALAERLPPSLSVCLVGSAAEAPVLAPIADAIAATGRGTLRLWGRLELPVLSALLAEARFTVSNDTGPMHLAAAVGGRVLGLFGSTTPAWTAPRGGNARWIGEPPDCAPCFLRECPLPRMLCLEDLAVERALAGLGDWPEGVGA